MKRYAILTAILIITVFQVSLIAAKKPDPPKVKCKAPQKKTVKQKRKPTNPFAKIEDRIAKKHAKKYEGLWTYTTTCPKGQKHSAIIKALRDKKGNITFSFLQNPFTSPPVFRKHSIDEYRASIQFKLDDSEKGIIYSIARKNDSLTGNLYFSWTDKSEKVTLRKLTLAQAVAALEQQYNKNIRLERSRKSGLRNIAELKKQVTDLQTKLKTLESEKKKIEAALANAKKQSEKQKKEYQILENEKQKCQKSIQKFKKQIEETQKLQSILEKKYKASVDQLEKSEKKVKSYDQKIGQLKVELQKAEKQKTGMSKTISDQKESKSKLTETVDVTKKENADLTAEISVLKENIQKLKKQNRTLQQQKKKIQKQLRESTTKPDQEIKENDTGKTEANSSDLQSQRYWSEKKKVQRSNEYVPQRTQANSNTRVLQGYWSS